MTRVGKRVRTGGGVEEGRPPGRDGGGGGVARHRNQTQELVSSATVGVIVVERGPDNTSTGQHNFVEYPKAGREDIISTLPAQAVTGPIMSTLAAPS